MGALRNCINITSAVHQRIDCKEYETFISQKLASKVLESIEGEIPEHKTFAWKMINYHQRHWEWKKKFGKSPMSKNKRRWSTRSKKMCHLVAREQTKSPQYSNYGDGGLRYILMLRMDEYKSSTPPLTRE